MKKLSLLLLLSLFAACGDDGNDDDDPPPPPDTTVRLTADITTNTTFTADKTYIIPGNTYRFVKPGATLTIEPGTVIQGEAGGVLVITRGAKIMAEGTAQKPIIMTSSQPVGQKTRKGWGGLLILGAAPINTNKLATPASDEATFEAFTAAIPEGKYGGTNAADNSGTLKYVRIEFGGFEFVSGREFNTLTLAGVGSGTTIDYVQVHAGADDGIEFFGGSVNVKHLVSSQNADDGFDADNGYSGKVQFLIVQNVSPDGAAEASNGYEIDNHGTAASYNALPRTGMTIYNATIVGNKDYTGGTSFAAVLRRGTGGKLYNHIFMNFQRGIEFRDAATKDQLDGGGLVLRDSIFFQMTAPAPQASNDIVESDYLDPPGMNNRTVDPQLADATNKTAPNFKPGASSPARTGCATPPNDGFFDATASFCGAMGDVDWTAGWTAYPQPAN